MGAFSNPFRTMANKLKNIFSPRDKAFKQAEKSKAEIKAGTTKDKRITKSYNRWSIRDRDNVVSAAIERLLRLRKKTNLLNTIEIRYFGTFRPIRRFTANGRTYPLRTNTLLQ